MNPLVPVSIAVVTPWPPTAIVSMSPTLIPVPADPAVVTGKRACTKPPGPTGRLGATSTPPPEPPRAVMVSNSVPRGIINVRSERGVSIVNRSVVRLSIGAFDGADVLFFGFFNSLFGFLPKIFLFRHHHSENLTCGKG